MRSEQSSNIFGETISRYTRAEAIEDGILFDVSKMAKDAGIAMPVAVTRAIWYGYIELPQDDSVYKQTTNDEQKRLGDILRHLCLAIINNPNSNCIFYKLNVGARTGKPKEICRVILKAIIGRNENGELVVTIMLPDED